MPGALHSIVARATFLSERLREPNPSIGPHGQEEVRQARLERWRQAIGPQSSDWLERRLGWDGVNLDRAEALLVDPPPQPDSPLPDWATVLESICSTALSFSPAGLKNSPFNPSKPIPFEDMLLPAIAVARERLGDQLCFQSKNWSFPLLGLVSIKAYQTLERGLLQQLASLSGQVLESEFREFLPYGCSLLTLLGVEDDDPPSDEYYRKFVQRHFRSGLLELFGRYPVLGRLIATAVALWVEATSEFLQRVAADCHELVTHFQFSDPLLEIEDIEVSLSDPHRGNRTVMVAEFTGGRKLVYKPKPLGFEGAFNRLLVWCNHRNASEALRVTAVLERPGYGWVEYLEQVPCVDEAAAQRFYVRAGMLLCLLRAVRATDCHHENLIAHGEHLVLIDAETVMSHEPHPLEDSPWSEADEPMAARQFRDSVLRTGLLPRWQFDGDDGAAYDVSGLGSVGDHPPMRDVLRWHQVNTDGMHTRSETVAVPPRKNVPYLNGRVLSPLEYQAELIRGFEQMYRFLLEHRDVLLASDGPLVEMHSQPVRFIYRATRIYGAVLTTSLSPDLLRSGIDYGIHLEQLGRAFLVARHKPRAWPVFAAEIAAMEQMDIPVFLARANDTALEISNGVSVPHALRRSSFEEVVESLGAMREADLAQQRAIIEGAFHAKAAHTAAGTDVDASFSAVVPSRALGRDAFLCAAIAIGAEIEQRALIDGENGASWIGLGYIDHAERFQLQVLDDTLYDGCCGVALFLAALCRTTGEQRFGALALRGLESSRRRLLAIDPALRSLVARLRGVGGAVGLSSTIYGFVQTAVLLNDESLLDDAGALAEWLTPDVIAADKKLDVVSGTAGALLSLLSLYSKRPSIPVLATAVACGDHLLAWRTEFGDGQRVWRTVSGQPLTGFSHGAAGIAYALIRLYSITGNRCYLDAALEGIEFERSVFSESRGNWPDLRDLDTPQNGGFPVKWCHGAAGIALARLGGQRIVDVAGAGREIEIALRTTSECYLQESDYLCCGNFGRVETFLVASRVTNTPRWRTLAEIGATAAVARANAHEHYRLFVDVPGMFNPGFFQGMAGIGYQLLRLVDDSLPSVLIWD